MAKAPHFLAIATVLLWASTAHAGKLDDTRDAVRSSSSSGGSGGYSDSGGGGGGSGIELPPEILCATPVGAIFCIPHMVFEPDEKSDRSAAFWRYPYSRGAPGHMVFLEEGVEEEPAGSHPLSFRLAGEYSYDWDTVHRPTGYALLETTLPLRPGLETGWTTYLEPLEGGIDHLTIGDINLTFRFAQAGRVEFRAGAGARLLIDSMDVNGGFNFTYGVDIFPTRPIVISLSADLGNLGRAFFFNGRGTMGAMLRNFELYAGYDVTMIKPVVFHGPVAGVRVWF